MDAFWTSKVVLSIGGILIAVFLTFLGTLWGKRIERKEQARVDQGRTQSDLYLKSQYHVYLELWKDLQTFYFVVNSLWDSVSIDNIKALMIQLNEVEQKMQDWLPLINDEHHKKIQKLLETLDAFRSGKKTLYILRSDNKNMVNNSEIVVEDIQRKIEANGKLREEFKLLMKDIEEDLRKHLSGQI